MLFKGGIQLETFGKKLAETLARYAYRWMHYKWEEGSVKNKQLFFTDLIFYAENEMCDRLNVPASLNISRQFERNSDKMSCFEVE